MECKVDWMLRNLSRPFFWKWREIEKLLQMISRLEVGELGNAEDIPMQARRLIFLEGDYLFLCEDCFPHMMLP